MKSVTKVIHKFLIYIFALILVIFTGYPFLYMVTTSFKSMNDFFLNPFSISLDSMTFEQYVSVFEKGLFNFFLNSIYVTVGSVILVVIISALASYPLSRLNFKLNRPLFLLFIVGMMIPIHATLIPIFIMSNNFDLYDSLLALIGPYVAFALPISIFIFVQFMREIPVELEEAAKLDGAGYWRIFINVIFPNVKPAISTVVIYNFVHIWNEFVFALVLIQSQEEMTLPLGLQKFYGEFSVNVPGLMAALTLASLPIIAVFIFSQERVVRGLTSGSVKG
ncbi:carbohydrate ABC transporter permease [Pallidibacillus thermolactis]|jgi:raffinose/stachyose/melibiose transport system permease protein|uniref:carbohydrate ABC transporter permease n=1 Tax=Pallidibacillus thermolactis TaxID=251051 RepID=UPI0021DB29CE|nr:carbohydrate ABC transporter permease [Pallidibacillus thermolactis]MCU9600450.1 carbohydrate ABC transporter permease [Pallidibacillus thermolactis subsp. kokeshiiformis]